MHRNIERYVRIVELLAKQKANVDTGRMRATIETSYTPRGKVMVWTISSPQPYSIYVHEGRGEVRPKRAKALRFQIGGQVVYAMRSRPYAGNPFLVDALTQGQPWPVRKR